MSTSAGKEHTHVIEMLFVPIHVADTLVNVSQVIKEMEEHAKVNTYSIRSSIFSYQHYIMPVIYEIYLSTIRKSFSILKNLKIYNFYNQFA